MKNPLIHTTLLAAAGTLSSSFLRAETITVLESFEDNVDNVTHVTESPDDNPDTNRRITSFVHSDNGDLEQITEGERALKVSFKKLRGWQRDFQVTLDKDASALLEDVVNSLADNKEIGRFFLLYDITWDKLDADAGWANNPIDIGGHQPGSQVEWGGGGSPVTMNLDLGAGLPEGFGLNFEGDDADQTYLQFIFNSNTDLAMDVYVDNIRLLDTKSEGSETVVTVLDSFEESLDALEPTGSRTEDPVTNEDAFFITEGEKSAKFTFTGNGSWGEDFTIDLGFYDVLNDILAMPREERFRYSIAWDWIPELGDASAGWFQESVNPGGPGMRVTMGWSGDGTAKIRVINLGLVDWDSPPNLTVIHNSNWSGGDMTLYLDNLRLIDTGSEDAAPASFEIATVEHKDDGMVTISWPSQEGASYIVQSSMDLQNWEELDDSVPSGGETTSFDAPGVGDETYYRVLQ